MQEKNKKLEKENQELKEEKQIYKDELYKSNLNNKKLYNDINQLNRIVNILKKKNYMLQDEKNQMIKNAQLLTNENMQLKSIVINSKILAGNLIQQNNQQLNNIINNQPTINGQNLILEGIEEISMEHKEVQTDTQNDKNIITNKQSLLFKGREKPVKTGEEIDTARNNEKRKGFQNQYNNYYHNNKNKRSYYYSYGYRGTMWRGGNKYSNYKNKY